MHTFTLFAFLKFKHDKEIYSSVWIFFFLPASLRDLPHSEFKKKKKWRLSSLDGPFRKPRQTIPVTIDYVYVYVYVREWLC